MNILVDCTRKVLSTEIDTSLSSKRVIRALDRIMEKFGKPVAIKSDNGPEFTSTDL